MEQKYFRHERIPEKREERSSIQEDSTIMAGDQRIHAHEVQVHVMLNQGLARLRHRAEKNCFCCGRVSPFTNSSGV